MEFSKALQVAEECSSSESGWTAYIASPEQENHLSVTEENEDCSISVQNFKKSAEEDAEDVDSDDSMASDASSGPSDQRHFYVHARRNRDERKHVGEKKNNQQEEKKKNHKQIKEEKDKPGQRANSGGRSNKM